MCPNVSQALSFADIEITPRLCPSGPGTAPQQAGKHVGKSGVLERQQAKGSCFKARAVVLRSGDSDVLGEMGQTSEGEQRRLTEILTVHSG